MKLPTLYKKTSTGDDQYWSVEVTGNRIISRWGRVGGTENRTDDVINEGKNLGKANATTPEQQAKLEAQALWEKKLKKGYVKTLGDAQAGKTDAVIEGGIFPLLAKKYEDHKSKVQWPAAAQRKLDGHRCIAMVDSKGKCTLWSRTRKPILSMPHIVAAVEARFSPGSILDGELFAEGYNGKFEELTSLIRPAYAKPGHEKLEYWIYDCVNDKPFSERSKLLTGLKKPLVTVETVVVKDEDEMRALFSQYLEESFEGLMLRDPNSLYVHKRSDSLLKVKERDDAEFRIVGVEEGKGKLAGHGIFVLETETGTKFRAKMKGDTEKLKQYWSHPKQWIGRKVTVAYQGLTSDGIPRFPVAVRVHDPL